LTNRYPRSSPGLAAVVSDGSTDRTDGIVRGCGARGVELIRVEGRAGKTVARNRAVARTGREILVFSGMAGCLRRRCEILCLLVWVFFMQSY